MLDWPEFAVDSRPYTPPEREDKYVVFNCSIMKPAFTPIEVTHDKVIDEIREHKGGRVYRVADRLSQWHTVVLFVLVVLNHG